MTSLHVYRSFWNGKASKTNLQPLFFIGNCYNFEPSVCRMQVYQEQLADEGQVPLYWLFLNVYCLQKAFA